MVLIVSIILFSGALWLFKQEFRLDRSWYSYSIGMFRNPAFIQRYVTKRTGQEIQHWIPGKRSWTSQILAKSCAGNCQIKINSEVDPTTFQEIFQFHRKRLYVQVYGLAQNSLQIWPRTLQVCFIFIKFVYSKKATILWKKNPQNIVKSNFVTFSEYVKYNFNHDFMQVWQPNVFSHAHS